MELAKNYDYDVLGHVTYPSRYIFERTGNKPDMAVFYEEFRSLFKLVIERGKGIEVNLSGLARNSGAPMPEADLLKLYRQCAARLSPSVQMPMWPGRRHCFKGRTGYA